MIMNKDSFERLMGELLWEKPNNIHILRCKGVFTSKNENNEVCEYML